jgi:hypothetical protein
VQNRFTPTFGSGLFLPKEQSMTKKYIGTKIITAFEQDKKVGENGIERGYCVIYEDGYQSWSPKETFERAYRAIEGDHQSLTFGDAIHMLKAGKRVARAGWKGKGMWLTHINPGNAMHTSAAGAFDMQPCIGIKTADGKMQPGWLASQADMLAEDWEAS